MTFIEFCRELDGFKYFNKKTNQQVYKYQMYWNGFTPEQCKEKFNKIVYEKK